MMPRNVRRDKTVTKCCRSSLKKLLEDISIQINQQETQWSHLRGGSVIFSQEAPKKYIMRNQAILQLFTRPKYQMQSSGEDYDCKDGQFNFFISEMIHESKLFFFSDTQSTSLSSLNDGHSSVMNLFSTQSSSEYLMESQEDLITHKKDQSTNQNKKRNTQNSIRAIVRKLKPTILDVWRIQDPKFFQSQKQLNLLAIFRKAAECQRLQHFTAKMQSIFAEELSKHIVDQNKDMKLQRHLNFFVSLTVDDLADQNIEQTIGKMSKAAQFKKHPTDYTVQQLLSIEKQIIKLQ